MHTYYQDFVLHGMVMKVLYWKIKDFVRDLKKVRVRKVLFHPVCKKCGDDKVLILDAYNDICTACDHVMQLPKYALKSFTEIMSPSQAEVVQRNLVLSHALGCRLFFPATNNFDELHGTSMHEVAKSIGWSSVIDVHALYVEEVLDARVLVVEFRDRRLTERQYQRFLHSIRTSYPDVIFEESLISPYTYV